MLFHDRRVGFETAKAHGDALADSAAVDVDPVIDSPRPQPHFRPLEWILRAQGMVRESVFEIFKNHIRFADHFTVVDQSWHHPTRIEFQIFRIMLIALVETGFDVTAVPFQPFFGEREAHLLRGGRPVKMIKFKRHV